MYVHRPLPNLHSSQCATPARSGKVAAADANTIPLGSLKSFKPTHFEGSTPELLGKVWQNFTRSLAQDTGFFKVASAPIASALLVAARIGVSLHSVNQAHQNNSDKETQNYIKEQALMTITREVVGLGLSYGLMSGMNISLDNLSQVSTGIKVDKTDVTGPLKALNQASQIILGQRKSVEVAPLALGSAVSTTLKEETGGTPNALQRSIRPLVKRFAFTSPRTASEAELLKAGMKNLQGIGFPLLSTGVSIYLAGWLLERTTLLHSDSIMGYLRHKRQQRTETTTEPPKASTALV
jgi:hypothetical protein